METAASDKPSCEASSFAVTDNGVTPFHEHSIADLFDLSSKFSKFSKILLNYLFRFSFLKDIFYAKKDGDSMGISTIIGIDQSTQGTKAILMDSRGELLGGFI